MLGGVALALPTATATAGAPATPRLRPCPTIAVPAGARSARPSPPALDQRQREVGGPELASAGLAIPAGAPVPAKLTATSWLVADLGSGAVLGACGAHEYATPASVQKLLLAATFMPRLDPARVVEVTRADMNFEPGSSAVGLVEGGRYPIKTLWLGLLLRSGNDAANVLARVGGGTSDYRAGVEAMNAEAARLGARQTHAVTPSGLDGPGQFTSAYDLALIARACYARADFRRYTATDTAWIPAQRNGARGFQFDNDNGLLHRYPGMLGGKTGFTDLAGQTYVGAAERRGRRLVVTLLGAQAQPIGSYGEVTTLLDWGFALPADVSVGQLIEPEPSDTPSTAGLSPQAAPAAGGAQTATSSSARRIGLAAGAAALLVALAAFGWARARVRPAAGERRRRRFARRDRDPDGDRS
ncbi:D-alanyl-D-alanine carboxypeptidase [Phytohabitans sp. ZYX-F-186]|uniref:D-alanyl-D-alanine carboxypeptidase n=1 Tax=Phytohabitans maris TaxID=3071409 RepID=A0ABU0ZVQ5_9ACTN|nr:D-alanyl-D-alanine carboxypeptidase [Phytohabitans sp. ZYX-F-186]MDQ7911116.1 D-alanyl-D-alanine carboxypeptidase [Phytohabitans sp. ZYX-F-186]